ncbi:MAG: carbamoyltransferase [candidate division Zixibacteria bacterium]|nr:carbamoyltransferase [candidate division Zixibacteria bacterium]MDH4032663.1 carbamoyltransferase [candidate division Zixibacteria bacterium]
MRILGISCFYHDSAAALVIDGKLVAAVAEERISRIKHDQELPVQAVTFCLEKTGLKINDLDYIVFYDKPLTKFDRILTGYMAMPGRSYRAFLKAMPVWLRRKLWTDMVIHKDLGFDGEILYTSHHLSHAAGAFFSSPFERSAILTVDGVGEWANASYGIGENNRVRLLAEMHYPHSVGLLYSAITYYLGFQVNSAEYKVMGLAPYGRPRFAEVIENELVTIHDDGSIHLNMDYFAFHYGSTMTGRKLEALFGQPRRTPESALAPFHNDVAASIQAVLEKIVLRMARHVRKETGCEHLCMSGGVALNCKANGLLLKERIFDKIYVQPASGDSGGAIGAALYAHYKISGDDKQPQREFGIGPEFTDDEIGDFLNKNDIPFLDLELKARQERLAECIANGHIVAIYQGAMEFGPRALGFRSILADPRDDLMKEKINAAVKYREKFRPFAPVVLEEYASEYFECHEPSPYMLFNFQVEQSKQAVIPAVTHVDGSSRIQTVSRDDNPMYYDIIEAFRKITGLPVLLNTSFNLRGHPIVHTPEQAFATFCSGGIDFLLMGRYLLDKRQLPTETVDRFVFEKSAD